MKQEQRPDTYFAVIFSSQRNPDGSSAYEEMADRMLELAQEQEGFLGVESARGGDGFGITVSYWKSEESIRKWKAHSEHLVAQKLGRDQWYNSFVTRVCKVEREYEFTTERRSERFSFSRRCGHWSRTKS